jgi:hypothetical protein
MLEAGVAVYEDFRDAFGLHQLLSAVYIAMDRVSPKPASAVVSAELTIPKPSKLGGIE